jgi:hypothetical protein
LHALFDATLLPEKVEMQSSMQMVADGNDGDGGNDG